MTNAPILTITFNPALDVTTATARLLPQKKLRCDRPVSAPGGGGVNVSRMIRKLGGASDAFVALHGPTGERYRRLAEEEGLRLIVHDGPDDTRESFQVAVRESSDFYRFILPGPYWTAGDQSALLDSLRARLQSGGYRWLVLSGSLPPGLDDDLYARIATEAAAHGIPVIADCSGPALTHMLTAPLFLLRSNQQEIAEAGRALDLRDAEPEAVARRLLAGGKIGAVLYSLGASGTVLVTEEGSRRWRPPAVPVRSLTGAGDSLTGALTLALASGRTLADAVRIGVAAAAAAALSEGSALAEPEDIARLLEEIEES